MSKFKVTLRPSQKTIEVSEGESLLSVLQKEDVYIKSSCGGQGVCSDCICKVVSGEDHLNSPDFKELKLLGNIFHITKERLLCQTKISGDVIIDISNHDKVTDEEKMRLRSKKVQQKKTPTLRRTKTEKEEILNERYSRPKKDQALDEAWQKHWEKDGDAEGKPSKKFLGGGKRPKYFDPERKIERKNHSFTDRDESYSRDNNEKKSFNSFRRNKGEDNE